MRCCKKAILFYINNVKKSKIRAKELA